MIDQYWQFEGAVSVDTCQKIISMGEASPRVSELCDGGNEVHNINKNWISGIMQYHINIVNEQAGWNFDIVQTAREWARFSKHSEGAFLDWHTDNNDPFNKDNELTRKLTAVLALNSDADYTGGDFWMMDNVDDNEPVGLVAEELHVPASLIVFPSIYYTKMTEIMSGTKYLLTYWAYGPNFK